MYDVGNCYILILSHLLGRKIKKIVQTGAKTHEEVWKLNGRNKRINLERKKKGICIKKIMRSAKLVYRIHGLCLKVDMYFASIISEKTVNIFVPPIMLFSTQVLLPLCSKTPGCHLLLCILNKYVFLLMFLPSNPF